MLRVIPVPVPLLETHDQSVKGYWQENLKKLRLLTQIQQNTLCSLTTDQIFHQEHRHRSPSDLDSNTITHWSNHIRNAELEPNFLRNENEDDTWTHKTMNQRGGGGVARQMQGESGQSTNILGFSRDGIWFCAFTMTNCQESVQRVEKQLCGPNCLNNGLLCSLANPWLESKWTGTGRYTGSVTQSIMASLTQPKAPGKHNRLRLRNSNSESRTYCFILSFWGPNLGPVGPRLENTC